ncbi:MAG: membrane protein insertion efficiency factor YidD [Desulfobacterota bacterium]|nr:membrane protein insertion efficiency factor YidD [Thermodesulfobacteriota bacterium]MDW8002619.1 membrane protein insertion efficiency factor YidD [Deltaproteobacteria bacterium]
MRRIVVHLIELYRIFVSPFLPCECRYYPTCSAYAKEAIEKKGIVKGILLALKRILRCNPFFPGGYDPVP